MVLGHKNKDEVGFNSKLKEILGKKANNSSLKPRHTFKIRDLETTA